MGSIHLRINGEPIAQPRPKITVRAGHGHAYVEKSHPVHEWKAAIRGALSQVGPPTHIDKPCELITHFFFTIDGGHFHAEAHTSRPDLDNLVKAVKDALSDYGFWKDDSIVYDMIATKAYADKPGADIIIRWGDG